MRPARACLVGLWVVVGCGGGAVPAPAVRAVPVETATVVAEDVDVVVTAVGTLEAQQAVEVKPKRAGHVRELPVAEGASVEAGQVLVVLDDGDVRARVDQARASRRDAEARLQNVRRQDARMNALLQEGIAARQQYDDVKAELDSATAAVGVAEANLAYAEALLRDTVIVAPFAGVLGQRRVDLGAYVKDGEAIVTLVDADPIEIVFAVPERHLTKLAIDQALRVMVASHPGRTFLGQVTFIAPEVDRVNRTVAVKAVLPNPGGVLRPGQFANVALDLERHPQAPVVPEEALVPAGDRTLVYVVADGTAAARPVQTGVRLPGRVEILDGLRAGDVVVRTGHEKLKLDTALPVTVVQAIPPARGG